MAIALCVCTGLGGSTPTGDRHGSMRTVIEWSHQLLDQAERAAFRRLGVFVGAFDLSAAAVVVGNGDTAATSDLIGRLADKSLLVHVRQAAGSRWQMLETVHAYAHEQLESSGEADDTRRRHHSWATTTARQLEQALDTAGWQEEFDAVAGDLRSALRVPGSLSNGRDAFELALSLGHLSYARRFLVEASHHFEAAVARAPDAASAVVALRTAAYEAYAEMRGEKAFHLLLEAFARALAVGDDRMAAIVMAEAAALAGRCPALFVTPLGGDEILALVDQAKGLAPPGDLEVAAHIALATAWHGARGLTIPTVAEAQEALERTAEFGAPTLISSALDAAAAAAPVTMGISRMRPATRWNDCSCSTNCRVTTLKSAARLPTSSIWPPKRGSEPASSARHSPAHAIHTLTIRIRGCRSLPRPISCPRSRSEGNSPKRWNRRS